MAVNVVGFSMGNAWIAPDEQTMAYGPLLYQLVSNQTRITYTQGDSDYSFVPYLCQLVFAAILWVELLEMFVTAMSLKYALSAG